MVNAQFIAMSGELTISSSGRFAAIRPVTPVQNHAGTHQDKSKQFAGDRRAAYRRDGATRVAAESDAAQELLSDRAQRLARLRVMAQILGQKTPVPAPNGGDHLSPVLSRLVRQYQPATTPLPGPVRRLYL